MRRLYLFAAAAMIAGQAAASPAHFLKDAIRGDYSELTLGRLIQVRGASPEVRNFGTMLARDHALALAQAQQVASRKHLVVRPTMAPEARDELYRLRRLSGWVRAHRGRRTCLILLAHGDSSTNTQTPPCTIKT